MKEQRGLGKGLQEMGLTELLSNINNTDHNNITGQLSQIATTSLVAGKYQPRRTFSEESLAGLAQSIKSQGIVQPIIARAIGISKYEIIAGERRWRAAKIAGITEVPVVIKELNDETATAIGLVENMQREDLNAIDLAAGMQRLITDFSLSHQSIANIMGKSRPSVTNTLRILNLSPEIQEMIKSRQLELGHAKTLLSLTEDEARLKAAKAIITKSMSVRATEKMIAMWQDKQSKTTENQTLLMPDEEDLQTRLSKKYGKTIKVGRGKLVVKYDGLAEIENILAKLLA
jgi:ParB family transcriptional regulator, chromosome partitioning protein